MVRMVTLDTLRVVHEHQLAQTKKTGARPGSLLR